MGHCANSTVKANRYNQATRILAPTTPSFSSDYDWPRRTNLFRDQPKTAPIVKWNLSGNVWQNNNGEIFINSTEMKTKILVIAHCGGSVHHLRHNICKHQSCILVKIYEKRCRLVGGPLSVFHDIRIGR